MRSSADTTMSCLAHEPEPPETLEILSGFAHARVSSPKALPSLDDALLGALLSWLSLPDLGRAAMVCAQWASVVRSDGLLWRACFAREFGGSAKPMEARAACQRCRSAVNGIALRPVLGPERTHETRLTRRAGAAAGALGPYIVIQGGATTGYQFSNSIDIWDPRENVSPRLEPWSFRRRSIDQRSRCCGR